MEAARLLRESHEVKTPQERSDEEAEAMPVESEPAVAEIHFSPDSINSKREINTRGPVF